MVDGGGLDPSWHDWSRSRVVDRGSVPDWQPILAEMHRYPWGHLTQRIEYYLSY